MLRKLRIVFAAIFFIAITLCFLDFTGTIHAYFGWMAKVQLLPAIFALNVGVIALLVVLTLLFGRIYCSVICPMGVMQDIISWIRNRKKKAQTRFGFSKEKRILRYAVLVVFVGLIVLGLTSIASFIAPYSAFGRIATNLLAPIYLGINNYFAAIAEQYNSYAFYSVDIIQKSVISLAVAAVTLVIIFILAWRGGRTYCNTICPVGTLLGLISRFAIFRPFIDVNKCNGCTLCARKCKASCIDAKNHKIDYSRCVACMDCIENCSQKAISFRSALNKPALKPAEESANNNNPESRRAFMTVASLFAIGSTVKAQIDAVDGGLAAIAEKKVPARKNQITPPGSISMRNVTQHCTACQLCVTACPNGIIRPSKSLDNLMQPILTYENGYCRPECNKCGEVCPTGAIRPFELSEKTSIQIGKAVWVPENCIVNTDNVKCGNCERHCPNGAIKMMPKDENQEGSPLFPVIDPERCIGCGACEYVCPARPFSAIFVEGNSKHRSV